MPFHCCRFYAPFFPLSIYFHVASKKVFFFLYRIYILKSFQQALAQNVDKYVISTAATAIQHGNVCCVKLNGTGSIMFAVRCYQFY